MNSYPYGDIYYIRYMIHSKCNYTKNIIIYEAETNHELYICFPPGTVINIPIENDITDKKQKVLYPVIRPYIIGLHF
jgi:hypothetical protein